MGFYPALYILFLSISVIVSLIIAHLFWQRRGAAGAKSMALTMFFAAQWVFSDTISSIVGTTYFKILWDNLAYIGVVSIPVTWLVFSLEYTKHEEFVTLKNILLLSLMPVLTIIILFTNDYHHLFEKKVDITYLGSITITNPTYGIWFWIHTAYSYTLIIIGTIFLINKLINKPKIYRNQSIMMIAAALTPLLGNVLFTFNFFPLSGFDPTMVSFMFTGLLCFYGMFRYKLFDLIPVAREAVIETMDDIVIVLDTENRIIDINTAAKSVFEKTTSDLIGKSIINILDDKTSQFVKYIDMLEANDKVVIQDGNHDIIFDFRMAPLYNRKGKVNGKFIVMRDITAMEKAIESLNESRKAAENANKAKSYFLATMSHEIRTPLNAIIGMSELLSYAQLTDDEKEYLTSIQSCANSLLDIISNILDFSKIEAGKLELEKTSFNIRDLVRGITNTFSHYKERLDLKFICTVDEDIPENLIGDPVRLKQILFNLISNAFKFTEKGTIKMGIKKFSSEPNNITLQFSVSDTGIGIPPEKADTIFNSFQQVDNSTTRKYGGTGLGLAIVKNLVSMMGGDIKLNSNPGIGSSFSFNVCFEIDNIHHLREVQKNPSVETLNPDGRSISILLAEDNKINQLFMVKLLEKMKFSVDIAGNGKIVLEKLKHMDYDIIFMDIQMPEMDGFEATAMIRKCEQNTGRHIPIIALTANASEEDRNVCIASGMDDYLSKPIKSDKLYDSIMRNIY